jgi:hypothetical protein
MAGRSMVRKACQALTIPTKGEAGHPYCHLMAEKMVFKTRNTRRKNESSSQKLALRKRGPKKRRSS